MPIAGPIPAWYAFHSPTPTTKATVTPIAPAITTAALQSPNSTDLGSLNAVLAPYLSAHAPLLALLLLLLLLLSIFSKPQHSPSTTTAHRWTNAWLTPHYPSFFGLVEYYILDLIPWGPWDRRGVEKDWQDKMYLVLLARMGIVPLFIQGGGLKTYAYTGPTTRRGGRAAEGSAAGGNRLWWWRKLVPRVWIQSRQRAYFDFVVFFPKGFAGAEGREERIAAHDEARKKFVRFLRWQHDYGVAAHIRDPRAPGREDAYESWYTTRAPLPIPLEVGAWSWFKWALPFLPDVILNRRDDERVRDWTDVVDYTALSKKIVYAETAFVHVESFDWERRRVDEWVYKQAVRAGLQDLWKEERRMGEWRGLLREHQGLEPLPEQDIQIRE